MLPVKTESRVVDVTESSSYLNNIKKLIMRLHQEWVKTIFKDCWLDVQIFPTLQDDKGQILIDFSNTSIKYHLNIQFHFHLDLRRYNKLITGKINQTRTEQVIK